MKISYGEFGQSYKDYKFAYCIHAEKEPGDILSAIYGAGFLPHSADLTKKDYFYMARSCRVVLKDFSLSSENKRVLRKFEGRFSKKQMTVDSLLTDQSFLDFCMAYFEQKHGPSIFTEERLKHILTYFEGIIVWAHYTEAGRIAAYVIENRTEHIGHYWFSFYDTEFIGQSLGMWLMLDATLQAQRNGLEFYYLGTAYGEKALYKSNIEQIQYWNGSEWSSDIKTLKTIMRAD